MELAARFDLADNSARSKSETTLACCQATAIGIVIIHRFQWKKGREERERGGQVAVLAVGRHTDECAHEPAAADSFAALEKRRKQPSSPLRPEAGSARTSEGAAWAAVADLRRVRSRRRGWCGVQEWRCRSPMAMDPGHYASPARPLRRWEQCRRGSAHGSLASSGPIQLSWGSYGTGRR